MSNNFQWQTEEDAQWEDVEARAKTAVEPANRASHSLRAWLWPAMAAMLMLAAGGLALRQINQRVTAVAAEIEAEVLTTHQLVLQAAQQQDGEILYNLLSGRNPAWPDTQRELAEHGFLFNPSPFGLSLDNGQWSIHNSQFTIHNSQFTLSDDLTTAELHFELPYHAARADGGVEIVTLQHTAVYRRGAVQWLLSPPDAAFWGGWETAEWQRLTLVYPQRDAAVARRLAGDLDRLLISLCRGIEGVAPPGALCPDDLRFNVRLARDPASLLAVADWETMLRAGRSIELPAPTLVGLPVDEAGYQALYRGYGALLVTAVMPQLVGYECCRKGLFYRALLEKQLHLMGLRPWPLTPQRYSGLLNEFDAVGNLGDLWAQTTLAPTSTADATRALVDFLLATNEEMSVAAWQQSLVESGGFWLWVRDFTPHSNPNAFRWAWLAAISDRSTSAQSPPIPLPTQQIHLVCVARRSVHVLYTYDLHRRAWSETFVVPDNVDEFATIRLFEKGDLYASQLYQYSLKGVELTTTLWQNDQELVTFTQAANVDGPNWSFSPVFFQNLDPTGRYLVAGLPVEDDPRMEMQLIDLHRCQDGVCHTWPLANSAMLWSPDGRYTLASQAVPVGARFTDGAQATWLLSRGDERGQSLVEVGEGRASFWVDEAHYGYFWPGRDGDWTLLLANVADDQPYELLRAADLYALLPETAVVGTLIPWQATPNPANARQLLLAATVSNVAHEQRQLHFLLDLTEAADAVTGLALVNEGAELTSAVFSPDGRWLAIHHFDRHTHWHLVDLLDLATQDLAPLPGEHLWVRWSPDGGWLLRAYRGYLLLSAPAHDYHRLIWHHYDDCRQMAWVEGGRNGQ